MVAGTIDEFRKVGRDVGVEKTHWSSWPSAHADTLAVGGIAVEWAENLTFVGGIINLTGNSGAAIDHRISQAEKVFYKWKPILLCRFVSVSRRIDLMCKCVLASLQWLSATWTPTKTQQQRLESWVARTAASVPRTYRGYSGDVGQDWRLLHREGHRLMRNAGGGFRTRRLRLLHRFAGHIARLKQGEVATTLRTRCLSWWRFHQKRYISKWDGLHPQRFRVWRWESQLASHYGEVEQVDPFVDAGWMQAAQYRDAWKEAEKAFADAPL